jgi:hypothetical protein
MKSPYENRPAKSFWKSGVAHQQADSITDLYQKRFPITPYDKVATAGSCFAQHISSHLRARNFNVIDTEPPPRVLPSEVARKWGYLLYSARFGNIYLVRQLLQLAQEAFGLFVPANAIWEEDGRYYDALRPSVEPHGLESPEAVEIHRKSHLKHVRTMFLEADVFVFTLGLTEGWVHRKSGTTYPTAPGTIAGTFDPDIYQFKNFGFEEILGDFTAFRSLLKQHNPKLKFLLTVSPVPLTATASDLHVLSATTYSKSVLRAVVGELYHRYEDIDYFPSYEIITSPLSRGAYYSTNLRSISDEGVGTVMQMFFAEHGPGTQVTAAVDLGIAGERARSRAMRPERRNKNNQDVVCEELLLEAFSR